MKKEEAVVYCEARCCSSLLAKSIVEQCGFIIRCQRCGSSMTLQRYNQLFNKEKRQLELSNQVVPPADPVLSAVEKRIQSDFGQMSLF